MLVQKELSAQYVIVGGSVPGGSAVKTSLAVKETWSRRSPEEGDDSLLQNSCLGRAWWVTVCGVARVGHNLTTKPPPLHDINTAGPGQLGHQLTLEHTASQLPSCGVSFPPG